jgi:predicted nucleotide-binding protein
MSDPKRIWVVHGRNIAARDAMLAFLLALGLSPIEWDEAVAWADDGAPNIGEVLDRGFAAAHAIVVLLTGDEMAYLRPQFASAEDIEMETIPSPQARPNVLFEAGMAFARYPGRTVLVTLGVTRQFSDVAGKLAVKLTDSVSDRQILANRLKAIGSAVDFLDKTAWHTAGNFKAAIETSGEIKLSASGSGYYYVIATSSKKGSRCGTRWPE